MTALAGVLVGIALGFFDQALVAKRAQRAIEVGRQNAIAAVSLLDVTDQAPAVPLAVGELEQHVEHERFERQKAIDPVAVLGHGPHITVNMILMSI